MGMSTFITFMRSQDDATYQRYLKVLRACKEAQMDPPKEVQEYFECYSWKDINNEVEVTPLTVPHAERPESVREISDPDSASDIWEVDMTKLPQGVRYIRFSNSY